MFSCHICLIWLLFDLINNSRLLRYWVIIVQNCTIDQNNDQWSLTYADYLITPPWKGSTEYCDKLVCLCVSLCLCVCLSTIVSSELHKAWVNSALRPSGVAKSSTSFGWGKGRNVTSARWQVTLCDSMWHVSSRSGVATLRTAIHLLLTYTFDLHQIFCACYLWLWLCFPLGHSDIMYFRFYGWHHFCNKQRLLDVTARLKQWGSHSALGLARRYTRCRQRMLGSTSCSQGLLGHSGRVEYLWRCVCT